MAARNNHQANKKEQPSLGFRLNTVTFSRVWYLLLIKITNTATHKHTDNI